MIDRTVEFLGAVRSVLSTYQAPAGDEDAAEFLRRLGEHGLTLASAETLREMERLAEPGGKQPPRWAVFEQVGHRRYACRLSVETEAGREVYHLDIPTPTGFATKKINSEMMYAVHDTTEEVVRHLAARWADMALPVAVYELPKAAEPDPIDELDPIDEPDDEDLAGMVAGAAYDNEGPY